MPVHTYILRRLLKLPLVLLLVSMFVFGLSQFGGSPIGIYLHPEMTAEEAAELEERFGLDKSVPEQYVAWLGSAIRGDLGWSAVSAAPVSEVLPRKVMATLELAVGASIIIVVAGLLLGTFGATHRDRTGDHLTRVLTVSGASLPIFWFALLALILFYSVLGWAPIGRGTTSVYTSIPHPTGSYLVDAALARNGVAFRDAVAHIWLPILVLGIQGTAVIARVIRSSLVDELSSDYVDAARAKGLARSPVVRHARRNALIPAVTIGGMSLANLLQGVVVIELIFQLPGLGNWMTDAILRGDRATVMVSVLVAALTYVLINLVVDVLYAYLDPRLELGA